MIHLPKPPKFIYNFQKFCNPAETTFAYDRGDEHVEIALIKSTPTAAGHLEAVSTNKVTQETMTRTYSLEEIALLRQFFNRPEITREIENPVIFQHIERSSN